MMLLLYFIEVSKTSLAAMGLINVNKQEGLPFDSRLSPMELLH